MDQAGEPEIGQFLSSLARDSHVSASTQNQAWLMAMLLYGAGLRVMECCRLRVKDIDFSRLALTGLDLTRCPACTQGTMVVVADLPRTLPPWDSS